MVLFAILIKPAFSRDICTRFGVLRQVDSFLISQKETESVTFDISNLQKIAKGIESTYDSFTKNLNDYAHSEGLENIKEKLNESDLIEFDNQNNLLKITGVASSIMRTCEEKNATLFTPKNQDDLTRAIQIMKKLNIESIPVNIGVNRGYLQLKDQTTLGRNVMTDESTLKSWTSTFPLLTKSGPLVTGTAANTVTAFCEKINNPWDREGPTKNKWLELGKLLVKSAPAALATAQGIAKGFTIGKTIFSTTDTQVTPYPVPSSLTNIYKTFSKFSSPEVWEQTKEIDIENFKNLISDINKVRSLFKPARKIEKFAKKPAPAIGYQIDKNILPSLLPVDPDSIILEDSWFYPKKYLDSNSDNVPDQVEGTAVVKHAEKSDKIDVYEFTPLLFGHYRLEPLLVIQAPKHQELLLRTGVPATQLGIRCTSRDGFKICDGYSRNTITDSAEINTRACIQALMGATAVETDELKCPVSNIKNNKGPVGFRIDCSDNFNTVIDSKKSLFITPYCNGEPGPGYEANHFPLYLNTDCEIKAKYLKDTKFVLTLPQVEFEAEGSGDEIKYLTPFENNVDFHNTTMFDAVFNLPQSGVTLIVSLASAVFILTFSAITLLVYCCLGPKKFKQILYKRFPCCKKLVKFRCYKLKCKCESKCCKKIKLKKPSCSCCQYASEADSVSHSIRIPTPGLSRPGSLRPKKQNPETESLKSQFLNFMSPSAPKSEASDDEAIELAPLNPIIKVFDKKDYRTITNN